MPAIVVITPPASTLVSLVEAKAHLRVDHDDDNTRIQALIWAAQNEFDAPDGWTGRAIGLQTLELRLNSFPGGRQRGLPGDGERGEIVLPCPPLLQDDDHPLTVKYTDRDGVEQTVDASTVYQVVKRGRAGSAVLQLNYAQVWPYPRWQVDAVRIRYFAGYAANDVAAEGLKAAIKLHVEMNYDSGDETKLRQAINNLLSPYRVY